MRAYEIRDEWGLENLLPTDRPDPVCGPGEVLLRLRAISLNYRDLLVVTGRYDSRLALPLIPCSDGVGEVVSVGEGVTRVEEGDRVAATFVRDWISGPLTQPLSRTTLGGPIDGMLTVRRKLPAYAVVKVPEHLSDVEAATLPCAAVTAWHALVDVGNIRPGDTVLLLGTGGVSVFALQFAKMLGAQIIITSSSDDKLERARALGANHLINYQKISQWGKAAHALAGNGVDFVMEVGGANTLKDSLQAVRYGGTIALMGVLSGAVSKLNMTPIMMRNVRVQGLLVGNRDQFEAMNRAISLHQLRPVVDRTFPLDQVHDAFNYLADAKHFGKICITVS